MENYAYRWTLKDILLYVFLAVFFGGFTFGLIYILKTNMGVSGGAFSTFLNVWINLVAVLTTSYVFFFRKNFSLVRYMFIFKRPVIATGLIGLILIYNFIIAPKLTGTVIFFFPWGDGTNKFYLGLVELFELQNIARYVIGGVILASIWEELFFRGVLQRFLQKYMHPLGAVLFVAFIWGFGHFVLDYIQGDYGNTIFGLNHFITGLLLGFAFELTRSLPLIICLHMINNMMVYIWYFGFLGTLWF